MSRFFTLALGAFVAACAICLALFAVACSDDEQPSPQQSGATAQTQAAQQSQQDDAQSQPASRAAAAAQQQESQPAQPAADPGEPLLVVVSTQVIADWVRQIGGDLVDVRALVPAGADAHTLELSTGDVRDILAADLVIINGAGLEAAYEDAILSNAGELLDLAEALEGAGYELAPFSGLSGMVSHDDHDDHDDHAHEDEDEQAHEEDEHDHDEDEDEHGHEDDHDDDHAAAVGRLIIADQAEAHVSVIDLTDDSVDSGAFAVAAPRAAVYPSPTNRYAFVLARGPEDDDDRIHVFDGGLFLVEHGDHHDLISQPVSRLSVEIAEERPIHFVNSHGWTAIFSDARGLVFLFEEHDMIEGSGDYEPLVLDAGPQHGAALAISHDHIIVTTKNPDFPENSDDSLPVGVEVRDLNDNVVYDASNRSCPGMHGESHNAHGVLFGCTGGVLFLHAHDGEYEHDFITNPPEMREDARIGSVYGHHDLDHFFGSASYYDGDGFASDGIWLIDLVAGSMERVFDDAALAAAIDSHGETLFLLGADGLLYALDAHDGDVLHSAEMVAASEAGRPAMIIVGEQIFITDPADGHVLMVDADSLEVVEEWHVGGAPGALAFVGIIEEDDDHDDHDAHDEDEGHDHGDEEHEEDDAHAGHSHGDEDPHFWFDTELAAAAITAIAERLTEFNPAAAEAINAGLADYLERIEQADTEVRALLADVPAEQRLLFTFHDAFGYFARIYDLQIVGFVVEGPEQGVSAQTISELIELIEHEGVSTVFHEPQFSAAAIDTLADEAGVNRSTIWSQPTEDQPTYIDILLANARSIASQ